MRKSKYNLKISGLRSELMAAIQISFSENEERLEDLSTRLPILQNQNQNQNLQNISNSVQDLVSRTFYTWDYSKILRVNLTQAKKANDCLKLSLKVYVKSIQNER